MGWNIKLRRSGSTASSLDGLCAMILGTRGGGKSTGLEGYLSDVAKNDEYAVVAIDRPGTLTRRMVGHNWKNGIRDRTYIEFAKSTDKVLSWPFAVRSTHPDPHQRKLDDDLSVEQLLQAFFARRSLKGGQKTPYIEKFGVAAGTIWLKQRTPKPANWLLWPFRRDTEPYDLMMDDATEAREAIADFAGAGQRAERNRTQWEIETGGAERLLRPADSPAIYLRHGHSFGWTAALENRIQMYWDMSSVSEDVARTLTILIYIAVANACRRYHDRHKKPLKVILVLEECGALDLVTPFLVTAMQELRKAGFVVILVSQTILDFQSPEQFEQLLGLCDLREYYRMNSGVDRAAKDLATATFDPMAVHYTRERMVNSGVREVPTKSKGISRNPDGSIREDERDGSAFLADYQPVIEEYYKPFQLQESEWANRLSNLQQGQRIVRDLNGVRRERVTRLPDPWGRRTEERTDEVIEAIRSRPEYQPFTPFELPPRRAPKGKKGMR